MVLIEESSNSKVSDDRNFETSVERSGVAIFNPESLDCSSTIDEIFSDRDSVIPSIVLC